MRARLVQFLRQLGGEKFWRDVEVNVVASLLAGIWNGIPAVGVALWRVISEVLPKRAAPALALDPVESPAPQPSGVWIRRGGVLATISLCGTAAVWGLGRAGFLPYFDFEARLVDRGGHAEPDAMVLLRDPERLFPLWTTSDGSGRFGFEGLKRRPYSFFVFREHQTRAGITEFDRTIGASGDRREDIEFPTQDYRVVAARVLHFPVGSAEPLQHELALLNLELSKLRKTHLRAVVFGHADEEGGERRNQDLSEARARRIARILPHYNPALSDPVVAAFGSQRPAKRSHTREDQNRRVEIFILENFDAPPPGEDVIEINLPPISVPGITPPRVATQPAT